MEELSRRPLASRSSRWASWLAGRIAHTPVTPNQISLLSLAFAGLGAALILRGGPAGWLGAAAAVQLRLACNLLDGMVAVEGGKATPDGALFNELPDRLADIVLLVALGYAAGLPWLGWVGALCAVLTAYIRALGASLGRQQDFGGPLAKPQRMAVLTAALVVQTAESAFCGTGYSLSAAATAIAAGGALTCVVRTGRLSQRLRTS